VSGVFGIVSEQPLENMMTRMERMGQRMSHRPWYMVEHWATPDHYVGLGRIGIGVWNREPQPVSSPDGSVRLVMYGEFYQTEMLRHRLAEEGFDLRDASYPELALCAYRAFGSMFASYLEGVFIIALWDSGRRRFVLTNDRFGLCPTFWAHFDSRLVFAPEVKGILSDPGFAKRLDKTALAQYMRFQHLLGERTFFEGIQMFPSASVMQYDLRAGLCQVEPYWSLGDIPARESVAFDDAVAETGYLLRRAVNRLAEGPYRLGVYLSGGLDSRTILGLIQERPVVSLTYGARNSRDVHYARKIARATGSDHHWCEFKDGSWVIEQADFHLELTEGFHSWIHAHGISTLPQARELVDVYLTGWDGGTVMGHEDSIEPLQVNAVDDSALAVRLFYLFNQKYTWPSITGAEEHLLYTGPFYQVRGLALESFYAELHKYLDYRPDVRGEYFYIRNHCGRLTQNLVTFSRSHVEVRFPFFDYNLFDYLYSLPAEIRGHRMLYRAVIQREIPRLAFIPYDQDEFLPTSQSLIRAAHTLVVKLKRRVNRHFGSVFPERATLYADYENYLRHELRPWAEEILFDRRTLERGIFNPDFIRSIWARHQSGRELWTIGKIAPIMTYEMMLRRLYD